MNEYLLLNFKIKINLKHKLNKDNRKKMNPKLNKYPIPEKFPEILHDYIKEVIRFQPSDIIDFSVEYFASLEGGKKIKLSNHTRKESEQTEFLRTTDKTGKFYEQSKPEPNSPVPDNIEEAKNENSTERKRDSSSSENDEQKEQHCKNFVNEVIKSSGVYIKESKIEEKKMYETEEQFEKETAKSFIADVLRKSNEEVQQLKKSQEIERLIESKEEA